jgi:hypothetical protein
MTTNGILHVGCLNLKIIGWKKACAGRLNKYSVGKWLFARIE